MFNSTISIFFPSFGDGGVERMLVYLARGWAEAGAKVDFLISTAQGPYLDMLPPAVRLIELKTSHPKKVILPLARYMRRVLPDVLMSVKRYGQEALLARQLAQIPTKLAIRSGTTESQRPKWRNLIKRRQSLHAMRKYYPKADYIIAVSMGVAQDISAITGLPEERIAVIFNPVVTPEMSALARKPVDHPWFNQKQIPIVLGAGGFRRQKDFPTLMRAFACARQKRPLRLVILGKGRQRSRLEMLAAKLGILEDFSLPGFVANPYAYMSRSNVFVLSSRWEGSPNVITEALALGTPVVSTDCRSGPREILQNGRYGRLVPVGDIDGLAQGILETLDHPLKSDDLREAVKAYTLEASTKAYLEVFGLQR